jgi:deazaflavin-dependent oxidoreductase (nitroreductase family)
MENVKEAKPPTGLGRIVYRLPIHLYRMGLGWLFGHRLMLVNHIGRVSGKRRQVVLEVVNHDAIDAGYVAVSGFGPTAAWYQNVLHTPDVTIQVGRRVIAVRAVPLSVEEGAGLMAHYARRHPTAAKRLCRIMGYAVDGSEADFRTVGRRLPFIRFVLRH